MAIFIETEKKKTNWFAFGAAIVVVVAFFVGGYILFFKKPELIEVVAPKQLEDLNTISKLSFQPDTVVNSPAFKLLKKSSADIQIPVPGRSNPFKPL